MKTMKTFLTAFLILFVTNFASSQASKTLVKSFNIQGNDVIVLDLGESAITVEEWANPTVRIQIEIDLETGQSSLLKNLIRSGRYSLVAKPNDEGVLIYAPLVKKKDLNKNLNETISYTIFAPKDVTVKYADESLGNVIELEEIRSKR